VDNNGDTLADEGYDYDGNTVPDCTDAAADTDGDTIYNPNDPDDDSDGFNDDRENWMGTDPLDACPDDTNDDAWPPDVQNDGEVDILDVLRFKPVLGSILGGSGPQDHKYNRRYDLNADGQIDILDVLMMKPHIGGICTQ